MNNPIYQQYGNAPTNDIFQRFNQFKQAFTGDPRQQVQNLLNSGRVTQSQYNQAVQIANQFQRMMGGK